MAEAEKILHQSWTLKSTEKEVQSVTALILKTLGEHQFNEDIVFGIHLSLEEAFVNAIRHGNHGDPNKTISVECLITPEKFDISISDEGFGFDPEGVPDPRCNGNLYKCTGRGVLLIQSYMDVVEYNARGNCVHMIKYRKSIKNPSEQEKKCS